MLTKVNRNPYLDEEDEIVGLGIQLDKLIHEYEDYPRWFFLASEWGEYVQKKVAIKNRLRKLKEKIVYDTSVVE